MKRRAGRSPWPSRISDRGAQNERTSLSWTRSALALLGVGLIVARIAYLKVPTLGVLLATVAVAAAVLVLQLSIHRYQHAARRLKTAIALPDGVMPLALCLVTVSIGVISGWLVLQPR